MKIYFGHRDDYFDGEWWKKLKKDIPNSIEVSSIDEAFEWLRNKLKELRFKSYYHNCNYKPEEGWIEVDFGSYVTFLLIYEISANEMAKFIGGMPKRVSDEREVSLAENPSKPDKFTHSGLSDYID